MEEGRKIRRKMAAKKKGNEKENGFETDGNVRKNKISDRKEEKFLENIEEK